MSLLSVKQLVEQADKENYAVPAFNAYNVESVIAILESAERLKSPVIIQAYDRLFNSNDAVCVAACVKELSKSGSIPVALHLDHGSCEKSVIRAFRYGYTGVMIDGSTYEYDKNVELTKRVVTWADYINIPVEGELGHVGMAKNDILSSSYTDPDQAKDFVQKTGVTTLAVMVGSAHGMYKEEPKLDIERIAAIKEATNTPLVLHGGSGIPDSEIKKAIAAGIRKINVATAICLAYYEGFKYYGPDHEMYTKPLDVFMQEPKKKVNEFIEDRIRVFGAEGRA